VGWSLLRTTSPPLSTRPASFPPLVPSRDSGAKWTLNEEFKKLPNSVRRELQDKTLS
jgi:hypothetical protein